MNEILNRGQIERDNKLNIARGIRADKVHANNTDAFLNARVPERKPEVVTSPEKEIDVTPALPEMISPFNGDDFDNVSLDRELAAAKIDAENTLKVDPRRQEQLAADKREAMQRTAQTEITAELAKVDATALRIALERAIKNLENGEAKFSKDSPEMDELELLRAKRAVLGKELYARAAEKRIEDRENAIKTLPSLRGKVTKIKNQIQEIEDKQSKLKWYNIGKKSNNNDELAELRTNLKKANDNVHTAQLRAADRGPKELSDDNVEPLDEDDEVIEL